MRKCLLLGSIMTIMLMVGAGCSTNYDNYCCESNDLCVPVHGKPSSCSMAACGKCDLVDPLQITPLTLPDAGVGQINYSVELEASGGIPPYTWLLARGDETNLAWITLTSEGDNNKYAKLMNNIVNNIVQYPVIPTTGDGIPLTITLVDGSRHGKAIRLDNQGFVAQMNLKIINTVLEPVFSPPADTYSTDQAISLSCGTSEAIIYYTTDGVTTPTTDSPMYTGASIPITGPNNTITIMAIAMKSGMNQSGVASATYTVRYQYQLTINSLAGGITSPSGLSTVDYNVPLSITATPDTGYSFVNWTANGNGVSFGDANSASTTVTLTGGNATIQANFTPIQYQLTVDAGSGGGSSPSGTVTVNYGSATSITATPNTGYSFVNWRVTSGSGANFGNANSANTTVTLTGGDATIQANFATTKYQLTVNAGSGGSTSPSGTVTVNYGVATSITATPNTGYNFVNWTATGAGVSLGNSNSASTTVTLTGGDSTIQANFTPIQYQLTVNAGSGGSVSPSGAVTVNYGEATSITATLSTGYSFSNWTIAVGTGVSFGNASSASTTATLTGGNATIRANFIRKDVYAGGYGKNSSGITVPGYWKNGTWNGLTPLDVTKNSVVTSIVISGGDVYVGGISSSSSGVGVAGYWKNGIWNGLTSTNSSVMSLAISGSDVYAGGYNYTSPGVSTAGYWKNTTWIGLTPLDSFVESVAISGSDVYAGGYNWNSSASVQVAGYWKNGTWFPLPPLDATKNSGVTSIVISGGDVYAGGDSSDSSYRNVPGYWKNGTWNGLTPLDATKSSYVQSIAISGSDVYVGGYSFNSSGVGVPGYWKNGTWFPLPPLDATKHSFVQSIAISGNDVYAGGFSTNSSGVYVPGYWKNGAWNGLTPLDATKESEVKSIAIVSY